MLSYAPYTSWAKHAAHHTQVDFLIDATLDQRAPLTGLQDRRLWWRHFVTQTSSSTWKSPPGTSSFSLHFSLHGTGCSEATTTLQYVLTTGPTTEDRLSRAPRNSGSPEKKRINKAKFSKPLTFSLPPSRKRAWSVLNHRRHVTPFYCRRFLFSFHSGLWMLSTLKQSELINTSL